MGSQYNTTVINPENIFDNSWTGLPAFKGNIPELMVFDRQLSENEIDVFESYLALKYGITLNKDYRSGKGLVIWNMSENSNYNHRIIGYGREDALGFDQKMATTSYEEKPLYSDMFVNDTYENMNSYNLSTRNRLLVVGLQPGNSLNNSEFVLIGDNNEETTTINSSNGYIGTMPREWFVKTTLTQQSSNIRTLNWEVVNLNKTVLSDSKTTFYKPGSDNYASAKTTIPLKGKDGYISWTVEQEYGPIAVGFGSNQKIESNQLDVGYYITPEGHVKLIKEDGIVNDSLFTVEKGQRIEVEKSGNIIFLRIDGVRYKNTEYAISNSNINIVYYGGIFVYPSLYDIKISQVRHGGFVDTGNKIELSYSKATEFTPYRNGKTYLLITRNGQINSIASDETDENRTKIIFNNVFWEDGDKFTFAFKGSPEQLIKNPDSSNENERITSDNIRVYYKNPNNKKNITVSVETAMPSTPVISVYDMSGRKVNSFTLPEGCETRNADVYIDIKGVYMIKVLTNDNEYSKKVIVF